MENKETFKQLYDKLYSENFNELETLRKKDSIILRKIITVLLLLAINILVFYFLVIYQYTNPKSDSILWQLLGFPISLCIMIISVFYVYSCFKKNKMTNTNLSKDQKEYIKCFKTNIITPIISNVFPDSQYYWNKGISEYEYYNGGWEYGTYYSEDKITATFDINKTIYNLTMSQVHVEGRHEDSDGHVTYSTIFHGIAGYIDMKKNMNSYIKIKSNESLLYGKPTSNVLMDMSEFEKIFDVDTNDRVKASQILTSDVMAEMIELVKTSKFKFEINIINNIMHIRFHTGEIFEPAVFKESLQFEYLEKYFDVINSVKNIIEHICSIIMNTEL